MCIVVSLCSWSWFVLQSVQSSLWHYGPSVIEEYGSFQYSRTKIACGPLRIGWRNVFKPHNSSIILFLSYTHQVNFWSYLQHYPVVLFHTAVMSFCPWQIACHVVYGGWCKDIVQNSILDLAVSDPAILRVISYSKIWNDSCFLCC